MKHAQTLLTNKNAAYANVYTFGTSVVLYSNLSLGWNSTIANLIISQVGINKHDCAFIDVTSETDLPRLAGIAHSEISFAKVLFIYVSKQALIDDVPSQILSDLERKVFECRKADGLSTFLIVYGQTNESDKDYLNKIGDVHTSLALVTDVQVIVNAGHTPDSIKFRNTGPWTHSIVPWLSQTREFDVDKWENVGFLDIDETMMVSRTFIRTKWAGVTATQFSEDPIKNLVHFDQEFLAFLKKLSARAKIKWVLSSTWRLNWSQDEVRMFGKLLGLPIIGKTESGATRDEEIEAWLIVHPTDGLVVTVDNEDLRADGTTHIPIDPFNGANWSTMVKMSELFGISIYDLASHWSDFQIPSK